MKTKTCNYLVLLSVVLSCFACGVSESEYSVLKEQNDSLVHKVNNLESRLNEVNYMTEHSQVVLPNTVLKEITSSYNGQNYKIKIQLPRGYNKSSSNYSVLYVTDAETNFGGVSYIVQRLIKDKLIPPTIIVGIAYGTDYESFYELRSRDLTPEEVKDLRIGGKINLTGGAPKFCEFLENELIPFIEKNYRTNNNRALYGHSYGGLFGTYVLLNHSELFNKYLILSPSLWFKDEVMLNQVEDFNQGFISTKVYMGSGELEGRIDDLQIQFANKLNKKQLKGLNLKSEIMNNETHRTIFGPAFTNGMRFLFEK